ncbi:MAG: glycosyl hydrolase [Kiritimatiellia bacterium]|jgi:tetratricopeptide (TPR) repeat protein|nr:glycosyl hydrolase [Kiritimatiellia bacterium]MDP6847488.1 glycosyl hydrolase [Kiritimatiellia bacterium]
MRLPGAVKGILALSLTLSVVQAALAEQAWQVTGKAWEATEEKNWDEVVKLAERSEREWGAQAKKTNDGLSSYPKGEAAKQYANLNELATITMLKGDALVKKGDKDGALAAYYKLVSDYEYGQCWDNKGWWWQPATAARDKITQLQTGKKTPEPAGGEQAWQVTGKAWKAIGEENWDEVVKLAERSEREWGALARHMNDGLRSYPEGDAAKQYANLNELATITMLKGDALLKKGDNRGALAAYRKLISDYQYGQCWDPEGWWWGPASAAKDKIHQLDPSSEQEITIKTAPLKASLKLPGKKGICLTMRDPAKGEKGTWEEHLPRTKAVKPYWNYTWGSQLAPVQPSNVEFVPMAWGAWSNEGLKKDLEKYVVPQIKAGRVKRFLGYNEPDKREQANMSFQNALKYWPILEKLGVPLCSPACANPEGVDDDTVQGVTGTWMRDFMREADKRGYRVDYTGVHWYGGTGATSFKEKLVRIYNKYGKRPLLITEFAPADWGAKTLAQNSHSPEAVLNFMKDILPWMERQDWIAGYAWFSFGQNEPQGTSSALFDRKGNLTACGRYYASITTKNPEGDQSIEPDR